VLFLRRNSLVAPLVVTLLGTPAVVWPATAAHGGVVPPPILRLAVLPRRSRVRRPRRFAGIRVMALRILGGRQRFGKSEAGPQKIPPRAPPRASYARGPPPSPIAST
jgi:hypothetical protein